MSISYDVDYHLCEWNVSKKPRDVGPGKNDWGRHIMMQKFYVCRLCGKAFWEDQLPGSGGGSHDETGGASGSW